MSVPSTSVFHYSADERQSDFLPQSIRTERTYVKNLQELVDIYVRPSAIPVNSLGNVTASSKETVVPQSERKIVFGGLDALFTFHKESFFPALEAAAAPLLSPQGAAKDADSDGRLSTEVAMEVGRTFVAHAAFMKMYSSYIKYVSGFLCHIVSFVAHHQSLLTIFALHQQFRKLGSQD